MRVSYFIKPPQTWWFPLCRAQGCMRELGVTWESEGLEADVYLVDSGLLDSWDWRGPTVVFEKIDQSNIGFKTRQYIDKCIGIIKPACYDKLEDHNGLTVSHSRLPCLIEDNPPGAKRLPPVTEEHLKKVRVINTNTLASVWNSGFYFEDPPEKKLGVGLSMQHDGIRAYRVHRKGLMCKLVKSSFYFSLNACAIGHPVSFRDSFEILRQSRVAVCPFGVTEHCFRDWEATLAGCVIVKPQVQPMSVWDYPWRNVVWCNPNWSDLEEKIREAIDLSRTPHFMRKVETHRQELIEKLRTLDHLARGVKSALESLLYEAKQGTGTGS